MINGSSHQEYILLVYTPDSTFRIQKANIQKTARRNRKITKIMENFNIPLSLALRETDTRTRRVLNLRTNLTNGHG